MKVKIILVLLVSHMIMLAIGFVAGIYTLPILIAPQAPEIAKIEETAQQASFHGEFKRDLKGSDTLHWGEGKISVGQQHVGFMGKLAPGPDYKLYLAPKFVENEEAFNALKTSAINIGDVRTFENFLVSVPNDVDISKYNTVVVWCESFGEFITSAQYQ